MAFMRQMIYSPRCSYVIFILLLSIVFTYKSCSRKLISKYKNWKNASYCHHHTLLSSCNFHRHFLQISRIILFPNIIMTHLNNYFRHFDLPRFVKCDNAQTFRSKDFIEYRKIRYSNSIFINVPPYVYSSYWTQKKVCKKNLLKIKNNLKKK